MAHSIALDPQRPEFQRVHIEVTHPSPTETEFVGYSTGQQRSSQLLSMKSANGLIQLPSGESVGGLKTLPEGSLVKALLMDRMMFS